MRVDQVFARTARRQPHDLAWVMADGTHACGFAEADRRVSRAAASLQRRLPERAAVALLLSNHTDFLLAYLAVSRAGMVSVLVNVRLGAPEVERILQDSGAALALTQPDLEALLPGDFARLPVAALLEGAEESPREAAADENDLCDVLYTSGTTGQPKGVEFSHRAALAAGWGIVLDAAIAPRDVVMQLMPLTHSAPLHLMALGSFLAGATQVVGSFDPATPRAFLEVAAGHRVTHAFAAPVAYLLAAAQDGVDLDLSAVKAWIYGGAGISAAQVRGLRARLGGRWMGVYGLTEAGPNGTMLHDADHAHKAGSIGWRAMLNAELRLIDDAGAEVPVGEVGEIALRTESTMRGYRGRPDLTREVLDARGWLRTGDLARRDADGYLWIVDRKKDLIISGGVNVYPRELEDLLLTHPQVADAAVVGVPHPEWGESVCAVIVPRGEAPSLEALRSHLGAHLAAYKLPRLLRVVQALPRNASGKVLKARLRESVA
ncbi:acyl-CoA synthetase (AMP-forming)/AMP-acid ligase II [Deinobacterium chartae]|uniref:Acyl-CoA synthetase (AMP-forming)/AMP-acid ligase II n=1 Tax=Deinobacterium chartae TaxID=521158 RepID=A0A841HVC9_9DEIO|nr:acyl-CoA synthetase (AMP-forming)/AMP-acid ligase II [Deinobacterium chartae]